jgi:ligand-binding sensor domain-containing protein
MKKTIAIAVLFYLILFAVKSQAQLQDRYFRTISVDKGLSQSSVFAIEQDTLGFIWIGTQDGLNRYDSKGFKVYRPVRNVKNSLQSYYIRSLFTDHKGQLWVGGNQGISVYNYSTDSFTNYKLPRTIGEWYISSITEDAAHRIWATSITGEVFVLNPEEQNFSSIRFNASSHEIKKIAYIGVWQKQIILGTDVGLFKLNPNSHQLTKINLGTKKPYINAVYIDGEKLRVATEGEGVIRYNAENGQVTALLHTSGANSIADNNIRCVGKDTEGNIWLGTFKGLTIFNPKTNSFSNYYHQIAQPYTISQNSVRCQSLSIPSSL